MRSWYVYVDGCCVGTVQETSEELARCAALCKFDISADAELSVRQA